MNPPRGGGPDWLEGETRVESGQGQLTLICEAGSLRGSIFGSDGKPLTIGRDESCAIALPIAESSRRNSRIEYRGGRFWVSDLGSLNGTRVNDRLIGEPTSLDDHDRLMVCGQVFRVHLGVLGGRRVVEDAPAPAPAPPSVPTSPVRLDAPTPPPPAVASRPGPRRWLALAGLLAVAGSGAVVWRWRANEIAQPRTAAPPPPLRIELTSPSLELPTPAAPAPSTALTPPTPKGPAAAGAPPKHAALPARGRLEAVNAVSLTADSEMTLTRVTARGAVVQRDEVVVQYRKARPDAAEKQRALAELEAKYRASPEYADFIAAARKEAAEARAGRVTGVLRAPLRGLVVDAPVAVGTHVRGGTEILRLAEHVRVVTSAAAVEGTTERCMLRFVDPPGPGIEVRARLEQDQGGGDGRSLLLERFPDGLALGDVGRVQATCTEP